jgi:hypothetical protein
VTYTVNVSNGGPDTAENVVLTDNLPTGVSFVSVTPGAPDCTESSGVVTCDLGAIASGASVDVEIVVTTTTDGTITNIASVESDTSDPNTGNNSASEDTTVNPGAPIGIIVDNADPEFSTEGQWRTRSSAGLLQYGSDFLCSLAGDGANRAIFAPNVPSSASYEVLVWWVKCPACATNAPYTINHAGGSTTVPVDQSDRERAGQWNSLGEYTFVAGTSCNIVLTNDADGRVVADAVRLVPQ